MGLRASLGLAWIFGAGLACGRSSSDATLRLLEFRQRDFGSVALNEELQFYFSADLDRATVTSGSLRVVDLQGVEVAGERGVRGNRLYFKPELPREPDLSDGGLRPGTSYRVILGGFPRPDGIRSESGAHLSASLILEFRTAGKGDTSPLFLDPFLGPFLLWPHGKRTHPVELDEGYIVLEYGEALDPSSIPRCRIELARSRPGASQPERIEMRARLVQNRRDQALLLLEPLDEDGVVGRLEPDRYFLEMPGSELRTLGGRAVVLGRRFLELIVRRPRLEFAFSSRTEVSSELPAGCDGTPVWTESTGGLGVRYPAAAGSGQAGEVELRAPPKSSRVEATRLTIPSEASVELDPLTGPIVLCSQTSLVVRGRLTRRGQATRRGEDPLTKDLEDAAELPSSFWNPLSDWIERLVDPDQSWAREPWTVLIAGGDLVVEEGGSIDVEGPLVLIAGGWIRVEGAAVSRDDIWKTPEGGGYVSHARNRSIPLRLDPPAINPLRTRLTLGAMTRPVPWTPRRSAWRTQLVGLLGAGRLEARFLQDSEDGRFQFGDPSELRAGLMRLLVTLELDPGRGEPWDPPRFERLFLEATSGDPLEASRN